jgi:acyl-CoA synthetase (AMP-forming)/AMP-acid ligase II
LPAIVFNERNISYSELNEATDRFAKALINLGVEKGDKVLTILPQRPEYVISFLGASKMGAVTVPMDVRYREAELMHLCSIIEPKIIVSIPQYRNYDFAAVLDELKPELRSIKCYIIVGRSDALTGALDFESLLDKEYNHLENELEGRKKALNEDDDLIIIFTAGTTGRPKGAILSHKNAVQMNLAVHEKFEIQQGDRILLHLPPSHVGGSTDIITQSIVSGITMVILEHFRPDEALKLIEKERVTILGQVPTMYAMEFGLPDFEKYDLSSLRVLVVSGEMVPQDLMKKILELDKPVLNAYGCTEADSVTFTDIRDSEEKLMRQGYVGKPLPGFEVKMVDRDRKVLPVNQVGEVAIRGPIVCKGYYKMPEETALVFDVEGWFYTGDLGFLDEEGCLHLVGREKKIIRTGGYTVIPDEIENVLMLHPKVHLAAVVGVPNKLFGEVGWAFVVPRPGAHLTPEELLNLCKEKLADYKVPRRIIFKDSLPLTRLGKVASSQLKEEAKRMSEVEEEQKSREKKLNGG